MASLLLTIADADEGESYVEPLRSAGFEVTLCTSSMTTLAKTRKLKPDVIALGDDREVTLGPRDRRHREGAQLVHVLEIDLDRARRVVPARLRAQVLHQVARRVDGRVEQHGTAAAS